MIGKKTILELRRWTSTPDGMGGETITYAALRNITGVLSTIRGDERLAADKITVVADYYFYIDYPVGVEIQETDIFVKGTIAYKIIYVYNAGHNQNRRLIITLKQEE